MLSTPYLPTSVSEWTPRIRKINEKLVKVKFSFFYRLSPTISKPFYTFRNLNIFAKKLQGFVKFTWLFKNNAIHYFPINSFVNFRKSPKSEGFASKPPKTFWILLFFMSCQNELICERFLFHKLNFRLLCENYFVARSWDRVPMRNVSQACLWRTWNNLRNR